MCCVMGRWGVVSVLCYECVGCSQCAVLWVGGVQSVCCVMSGWGVVNVLCYEWVGCNQLCAVL